MLGAALAYAKKGRKVFPLHSANGSGECSCGVEKCQNKGKHPRTAHGFKDATADLDQIKRWWGQWPDANIGTPTGQGLVVLDIDPRHGGMESIARLQEEHEALPETGQQATGGDGLHFLFTVDGAFKSRPGIRPGVDLKADGGYIVLPPSRHASGKRYRWLKNTKPVLLPAWIHKLQASENGNNEGKRNQGSSISKGERNQALLSYAGTMRRRGMGQEEIAAALVVMNRNRCSTPLPESEVRSVAASVCRYTPNASEPVKGQKLTLTPMGELLSEPEDAIDWLVEELLPCGGVSVMVAKPKVGKSTTVRELAPRFPR